jgi:hypothetical protein
MKIKEGLVTSVCIASALWIARQPVPGMDSYYWSFNTHCELTLSENKWFILKMLTCSRLKA